MRPVDYIAQEMKRRGLTLWSQAGGTICPLFDACQEQGVEVIVARSEQGAGYMAIGAAKATRTPQVVAVTSGPGATNLITALADAYYDGVPIVALTGQVGTAALAETRATRKRQSGSFQGPLYKEDYFGEKGMDKMSVPPGKSELNLTVQKLEGQQFYRPEKIWAKTGTVITGIIRTPDGKPVVGAYAFAYRNAFRKQEPPDYGSVTVDASGRYYIYLDQGGDYVVGARMKAKEPPETGEPLGFWDNNREKAVKIAAGSTVDNVDIVLTPFAGTPGVKPGFIPLQK